MPSRNTKRRSRRGNTRAITSSTKNANDLTSIVEPWMPLFPAKTARTMRYSTNVSLSVTSGVTATHVFRANDLFDPDATGTGHQPMGFDQMMVFYNHFCVTHAKIIVTFKNASTGNPTVAIRQDAAATPITTIDQIIEFGGLVQAELTTVGTFGAIITKDLSVSIARLQGVNETTILADSSLRGNAAASPTELSYFHVQAWDANGNNQSVICNVIIDYRAVFTEPRDATLSSPAMRAKPAALVEPFVVVRTADAESKVPLR